MLGVPGKNIYERKNASSKDLKDLLDDIYNFIKPRSKPLYWDTGICGIQNYIKGFPWDRIKIRAMEMNSSNDFIYVSFNS